MTLSLINYSRKMSYLRSVLVLSGQSIRNIKTFKCCECFNILQNSIHKKNLVQQTRNFHGSTTLNIFYEADRKDGYETKVEKKKKTRKEHIKDIRQGFKELKTELALFQQECQEKFEDDYLFVRPGDMDKKWVLESEKDLEKWTIGSDSDFGEGYSTCSLTMSPMGHGLFTGNLNNEVPKDGRAKYSGYCSLATLKPKKSFKREMAYDWTSYTHLEIRVRGDGRGYFIVINTPGYFDISWFDTYSYPLYTRGGPYWQTSRIPFSKFYWSSKGRVQDSQHKISLDKVSTVGFTLSDHIDGPFNLEIDYVGLYKHPTHKEEFAYELYKTPHKFYSQH